MGGVSTSEVGWADGAMLFTGDLSLANDGGFTSVVSPALNGPVWASVDGVTIDMTGDGRTYTLQVRTVDTGNWIQAFPTTAGVADTVVLPWAGFQPVSRFLDPVPAPGPLDSAAVDGVAVYLVDGREGAFRLAVRFSADRRGPIGVGSADDGEAAFGGQAVEGGLHRGGAARRSSAARWSRCRRLSGCRSSTSRWAHPARR